MVFELKKTQETLPGLLVFSHKEYIKFMNTRIGNHFIKELKKFYFIGVHWGYSTSNPIENNNIDIHFTLPGLLPEGYAQSSYIIPLTTRNFMPSTFKIEDYSEKEWDVITIGRKVKIKRYLEFFLIVKKVLKAKPDTKILIISPEDEFPKKSTFDYLFEENYNQIFSEEEKKQIQIYSKNTYIKQKEIVQMLNRSKTFLFTSTQEGVAKVTAEAAMCGLKVLVYKNFIGNATYGISNDQLYLYKDINDAANNLIRFIEEGETFTGNLSLLKEEDSLIKLHEYLDIFYSERELNYDRILNSNDLRNNLNSFNRTLSEKIVLGNSNDIKNLRSFLAFCELNSLDVSITKKLAVFFYDIVLLFKEAYRKRKNFIPLFFWKVHRRRTQYDRLSI